MRLIPDPQSESSVAVLGVSTSDCPAPIEALAASGAVQRLFDGKPNCHPLRLTADAPVLYSSTHSRLAPPFCGSYMISLRMTSAWTARSAIGRRRAKRQPANLAISNELRVITYS